MQFTKYYFAVLITYLVLDTIWLNLMKGFYKREIPDMVFRIWPAVGVYIVATAGLVIFLGPLVLGKPLWQAFLYGGLLGLMVYGVYDFTNYATLARWSLKVSFLDMAWGIFAFGVLGVVLSVCQNWVNK